MMIWNSVTNYGINGDYNTMSFWNDTTDRYNVANKYIYSINSIYVYRIYCKYG